MMARRCADVLRKLATTHQRRGTVDASSQTRPCASWRMTCWKPMARTCGSVHWSNGVCDWNSCWPFDCLHLAATVSADDWEAFGAPARRIARRGRRLDSGALPPTASAARAAEVEVEGDPFTSMRCSCMPSAATAGAPALHRLHLRRLERGRAGPFEGVLRLDRRRDPRGGSLRSPPYAEKFGPVRHVERAGVRAPLRGRSGRPRHKSGLAVRFPRILRLRSDKNIDQADTLQRLHRTLE